MGKLMRVLGSAFVVLGTIGIAQAKAPPPFHPPGVPEIDPTFAPGAIALLVCGVLMLAGRVRRR